jgi:hypothetical protein
MAGCCGHDDNTGVAQKRAIVRTFFPEPLRWRLEECLRKGGDNLEDVVLKSNKFFILLS